MENKDKQSKIDELTTSTVREMHTVYGNHYTLTPIEGVGDTKDPITLIKEHNVKLNILLREDNQAVRTGIVKRCCYCEHDDMVGRNSHCTDCIDYSKFELADDVKVLSEESSLLFNVQLNVASEGKERRTKAVTLNKQGLEKAITAVELLNSIGIVCSLFIKSCAKAVDTEQSGE